MTTTPLNAGHAALLADRGQDADVSDDHPDAIELAARVTQLSDAAQQGGVPWVAPVDVDLPVDEPAPLDPPVVTPPVLGVPMPLTTAGHQAFWPDGGPR